MGMIKKYLIYKEQKKKQIIYFKLNYCKVIFEKCNFVYKYCVSYVYRTRVNVKIFGSNKTKKRLKGSRVIG